MLQNVLAWLLFVATIGFAIAGALAMFSADSIGVPAKALLLYGAIPMLVTALVLAVVLLVISAFQS